MTTIVHVLGCHLQAKRLNGDDWEKIVWADGTLAGRLVQGLVTTIKRDAAFISFGTGASEKKGVKESEYTRNFALKRLRKTDNLDISTRASRVEYLLENALIDDETQNTTEEVERILSLAFIKHVDEVIFVTSAFHSARAVLEVVKAHRKLFPEGGVLKSPRFSIVTSLDDPGDTLVIEEPHRGDLVQVNFSPVLRGIFKFLKAPELSEGIRNGFDEVIKDHEQKL